MVVADSTETRKEKICQLIDTLPDDSLEELATFVDYLHFRWQKQAPSRWFKDMVESFAPVQDAVEKSGLTEAEINAMIDDAIAEVRRDETVLRTKN